MSFRYSSRSLRWSQTLFKWAASRNRRKCSCHLKLKSCMYGSHMERTTVSITCASPALREFPFFLTNAAQQGRLGPGEAAGDSGQAQRTHAGSNISPSAKALSPDLSQQKGPQAATGQRIFRCLLFKWSKYTFLRGKLEKQEEGNNH